MTPCSTSCGGGRSVAHYSFLGLGPRDLKDRYADYWKRNVHYVTISRENCSRNPHRLKGCGPDCWG